MTLAFLAAELADLLTVRWPSEANRLVLALPQPVAAKLIVVAAFALLAYAFGRSADPRLPKLGRAMLLVGTAVGMFGFWSNVA